MPKLIVEKNELDLTSSQLKMVRSGWGEDSVDKTVVEKITYNSDGLKVKGYIAYPKDTSRKYPCIIWNRGGIGNAGVIEEMTVVREGMNLAEVILMMY